MIGTSMTTQPVPSEETTDLITAAALGLIDPRNLEDIAEHFTHEARFLRSAVQRLMKPRLGPEQP